MWSTTGEYPLRCQTLPEPREKSENARFFVSADMVGIFQLEGVSTPEDKKAVHVQCYYQLFPYAQQLVSQLCAGPAWQILSCAALKYPPGQHRYERPKAGRLQTDLTPRPYPHPARRGREVPTVSHFLSAFFPSGHDPGIALFHIKFILISNGGSLSWLPPFLLDLLRTVPKGNVSVCRKIQFYFFIFVYVRQDKCR